MMLTQTMMQYDQSKSINIGILP